MAQRLLHKLCHYWWREQRRWRLTIALSISRTRAAARRTGILGKWRSDRCWLAQRRGSGRAQLLKPAATQALGRAEPLRCDLVRKCCQSFRDLPATLGVLDS